MNRRDFLFKSSMLATASLTFPQLLTSCTSSASNSILANKGLQLYTLRTMLQEDLTGTLAKVAEIGYKEVEFFGYGDRQYFGNSIKSVRNSLKELSLKARSSHLLTGYTMPDSKGTLTNGFEVAVEDAAKLGQRYIVCAYLFEEERETLDDYKRLADLLNRSGEIAKQAGLQLAYHNHDFEFIEMEGVIPYDYLLENCDSELVKFEMDLYWMEKAKQNPVSYFQNHPGRFPLWHVKDMYDNKDKSFAPVGKGTIDWKLIFNHASEAGLEHFFVEQDKTSKYQPLDAIKLSYNYLDKLSL